MSLYANLDLCTNALRKKIYLQLMKEKNHTLHCLIHRYYEYFIHIFTIWEVDKCVAKYGCDDINLALNDEHDIESKITETCTYSNMNYSNIEQQASVDLTILELYTLYDF